jgi:hypothetical protein
VIRGEKSPIKNVEAMTSGGTNMGLSLGLEAWIRNAEASLRRIGQGMPDTSNDEAQDSPKQ